MPTFGKAPWQLPTLTELEVADTNSEAATNVDVPPRGVDLLD
jgi:hypothetical protein